MGAISKWMVSDAEIVFVRILKVLFSVYWRLFFSVVIDVIRLQSWCIITKFEVMSSQITAQIFGLVFVLQTWLLPSKIILLAAQIVSPIGSKL
jgi:hypothetical protein